MVAGFLVRMLKDRHPCVEAWKKYQGNREEAMNKLISLQDRGGLLYPSKPLVNLVSLIFDILSLVNNFHQRDALVKSWNLTLAHYMPMSCLVCGCDDPSHSALIKDLVLKYVCKIYFNNICTNATNIASERPKFSSKPGSKKIKKM